MTRKTTYDNAAQQRVLTMQMVLAGHELHGLAPSDIAKAMNIAPSMVTRDLHNLQAAGFAEQIQENGRWRLGPKLVQVALDFTHNVQRALQKVGEIQQRYTRKP